MAVKTLYTLNTANANWGQLQDGGSAPAAAASAYGWANAKVAAGYWRGRVGAAATANVTNTTTSYLTASSLLQGTGTTNVTASNAFRAGPYTGTFANTTWNFSFGVRTGAASHAGRMRIQVWKGANADGTGATRVGSVGIGSIATLNATATTFTTSGSVAAPGVVTLSNEYLFFEVEWQGTTAGTSNSCTTLFYQGVCTFTTPDFSEIVLADGAASGIGTATGGGAAINTTAGDADGFGAAVGDGAAVVGTVGVAAGLGGATGVGERHDLAAGAGATAGLGAAVGDGRKVIAADGVAGGLGAALAAGASSGASSRIVVSWFEVAGVHQESFKGGGQAAGLGTATAAGFAIATTTATASGLGGAVAGGAKLGTAGATVPGIGGAAADGRTIIHRNVTASGLGAANAQGAKDATTAGTALAFGAALGGGMAIDVASGQATGLGGASATGEQIAATSATVPGLGTATATGRQIVTATTTTASGIGAANGAGAKDATATATASGLGQATATGAAIRVAQGLASGLGAATSTGAQIAGVGVTAFGYGAATAVGAEIGNLRPDGDTATDGWTDQAGGGTNIYQSIDEVTISDSDFVQSPSAEDVTADLVVRLFSGGTEVAQWMHTDIPNTFTTATQTLTTPQVEAITNYSDLYVELDDNQGNVYRFPVSNPASGVAPPIKLSYRYKKLAA